jgi:heparosan-N-sulfate-glucuronate 5-epimerase
MTRGPTDPDFFSTARSFSPSVGSQVGENEVRGYYLDLRFKAESPAWPPPWLPPRDRQLHVATAQWALGCYERFLHGEGEEWLGAAIDAGDYLLDDQRYGGLDDGAWLHQLAMPHTYLIEPPWISAMAQGEGASLLVRLHRETGEERYAGGAVRALKPMAIPTERGGVLVRWRDGGPFYEEYPTDPASFVLNGGIFAIWGLRDVGLGLGQGDALAEFEEAVDALARNIGRWDTGYWSRYDLFPQPLPNIASSAYHGLHITQLRATQAIAPRRELAEAADRFERYRERRLNAARAFAVKSAFRVLIPRNRVLAHRMPWGSSRRTTRVKRRWMAHGLVLCYHAVSHSWPSSLAINPDSLREQIQHLLRAGFVPATFGDLVSGNAASKSLVVTFDDGFRSVHTQALPILSGLGVPATVFVPTNYVGRSEPMAWPGIDQWLGTEHAEELLPMNWDQLRELRDSGWEVGSHSCSHPRLTALEDEPLEAELSRSRAAIEEALDTPCRTLAYPYGEQDERVRATARLAGYRAGAAIRLGGGDPFCWPRVGVYPADQPWRFWLKTAPSVRWLRGTHLGRLLEAPRRRREPAS